jgi:hypothetical protein
MGRDLFLGGKKPDGTPNANAPGGKYDPAKRLPNEPIRDFKERIDREEREKGKAAAAPPEHEKKIEELTKELAAANERREKGFQRAREAEELADVRLSRSIELYETLILASGALMAVKHENGVPQIAGRVSQVLEAGRPE